MAPLSVEVREYKDIDLSGGTLVVSVPLQGLGNILFTDYMLKELEMDQVAALDSEAFPPLADVRGGKARFPVRVHADPETKVAVLRSEFTPAAALAKPLAKAILAWAAKKRIARIVALDTALGRSAPTSKSRAPPVWFVGSHEDGRRLALKGGLMELARGTIGGLPAVLLLEARFQEADVIALFAESAGEMDEAKAVLSFAKGISAFVPALRFDYAVLERELERLDAAVRAVRKEAEKAIQRLSAAPSPSESTMYG